MNRRAAAHSAWTFARHRVGKIGVLMVVVLIVASLVVQLASSGRWIDDSWLVLLTAGGLILGYVLLRRLLVVVTVTAVLMSIVAGVSAPRLSTDSNGDIQLLGRLTAMQERGELAGYQDLAVADINLDSPQPVRVAGLGATATTPMEVGSLTKAMTGLVIADAVARGEVRMDAPVSTYLPQLRGSAAGDATMHELVTHSAGYAEFGNATLLRALWSAPLGRDIFDADRDQTIREIQTGDLASRGRYSYSSLGAAAAGQAAAAATGMSYPDLMHTRLFAPLGMTETAIESTRPLVPGGRSASGLNVQPWVADGDAPAGAAVSTVQDLAILATAILDGTAPGWDALQATAPTGRSDTSIGTFWHITRMQTGRTITWHNGQTGGYTSYLGLDQEHHRAVIVLSDVAKDVMGVGIGLLAHHS